MKLMSGKTLRHSNAFHASTVPLIKLSTKPNKAFKVQKKGMETVEE